MYTRKFKEVPKTKKKVPIKYVSGAKNPGAREAEIFANLFSLKNDPKAYNLVKEIIPNTVIQFEKKLDEVQKRLSNVPRGGILE